MNPTSTDLPLGPGSFLAICSKPGIEWVIEKTGAKQFQDMAKTLSYEISRRLKLDSTFPSTREPEPPEIVARAYVKAYFDLDPEAAYSIVSRQSFENRLRAHFSERAECDTDHDPGWYALRNAVYAAGCRMQAVQQNAPSPAILLTRSWNFFLNALSKHTQLMYCRASLIAVQALAVMVTSTQD